MNSNFLRTGIVGALTLTTIGLGSVVRSASSTGPSTLQSPYILPSLGVVSTESILSVDDAPTGYKMVGIPDGMGAFDNGDGTFTLLMNHELGVNSGVNRAHNQGMVAPSVGGAFVSKWTINKDTLEVIAGGDLMQSVHLWDSVGQQSLVAATPTTFNRFCSGDLPEVTAFWNPATGLGTQSRIYMHGEEGGAGRQLATVVNGDWAGHAYVLGKFNTATNGSGGSATGAWENALASPYPQDKTVVIGNNDGGTGVMSNALAVYVGTKQSSGTEIDKAGLSNGMLRFVNVLNAGVVVTNEIANTTTRATGITNGMRFDLRAGTSTPFSRPEDGAWNPRNPNEFYFVTTDRLDQLSDTGSGQIGQTRLWRLTFDDITNPDAGGKIDLLIDGRSVNGEKVNMFDNMTVNAKTGLVVLTEDPGGAAHNAKVWIYDPATNELKRVAHHDRARFGDIGVAATAPFTNDEEGSGVIDASFLGAGKYLVVTQAHYSLPGQLVEGGQLQVMRIPFPVVGDKNVCKSIHGSVFRADGTEFKNQGDCIQYVNTGK